MIKRTVPSLSVFFPVYNEEKNIPLFVAEALRVVPTVAEQFEIIIVNDGSTDRSLAVAKRLARRHSALRVVTHHRNRGYGAALKSGFAAARYDWVFFTDGDLQFDLAELKKLIKHTQTHDVILGFRQNRAEGALRAFNARLFKLFIDVLFRLGVRDIDCAFKLIRTQVLRDISITSEGAFTSAECLYLLKKQGHRFQQVGVHHLPRRFGQPTGNNLNVIVKAGWEALRLYAFLKLNSLKATKADDKVAFAK